MSLWPHPTVKELFAELLAIDEQWRAKLREVEKVIGELKNLQSDLSQRAADTIQLSLMQRDNAEQALAAAKQPASGSGVSEAASK